MNLIDCFVYFHASYDFPIADDGVFILFSVTYGNNNSKMLQFLFLIFFFDRRLENFTNYKQEVRMEFGNRSQISDLSKNLFAVRKVNRLNGKITLYCQCLVMASVSKFDK